MSFTLPLVPTDASSEAAAVILKLARPLSTSTAGPCAGMVAEGSMSHCYLGVQASCHCGGGGGSCRARSLLPSIPCRLKVVKPDTTLPCCQHPQWSIPKHGGVNLDSTHPVRGSAIPHPVTVVGPQQCPRTHALCSTRQPSQAGKPGCHRTRTHSGQSGRRGACRGVNSCRHSSCRYR